MPYRQNLQDKHREFKKKCLQCGLIGKLEKFDDKIETYSCSNGHTWEYEAETSVMIKSAKIVWEFFKKTSGL